MNLTSFLGLSEDFAILSVECKTEQICISAHTTPEQACCPLCGVCSTRIRSHYQRTLTDLPAVGKTVHLTLTLRRFRCCNANCLRQIFCEPIPQLAQRYAHCTLRLQQAHANIARSAGGRGGARLAQHLAMPTSVDSLLRRLKALSQSAVEDLVCVGVDDWALRKGASYGTIIVDLHTHRVVDLLPDRQASTLTTWLKEHQHVHVVSRDRAGEYSKAARDALPNATQVADRWHLLQNTRQCLQRVIDRLKPALRSQWMVNIETSLPCSEPDRTQAFPEDNMTDSPPPVTESATRFREAFEKVHRLSQQGKGIREIARLVGISRITVRRYLTRETFPQRARPIHRRAMEHHREYIEQRMLDGCTNAAQLSRELQEQGFNVSYTSVSRFVASLREGDGCQRTHSPTRQTIGRYGNVSAYRLSWWLLDPHYAKEPPKQQWILAGRDLGGELWEAVTLLRRFRCLVRQKRGERLSSWLAQAEQAQAKEVRRFAERLRQDNDSIEAALALPWSNGVVEGHVHRLKLIKRSMYGRAGFALLRQRVILEN